MTDRPLLQTERFDLWHPVAADLDSLCALIADEETRRFLGPVDRSSPHGQFERLMRNAGSWAIYGYGTFMVRPRGETDMIAGCGVFHSWRGFGKGMDDVPEAGWVVRRDWWGKGLASEVMTAAISWFDRQHSPRRITCMIEEGNVASERVASRLGFVLYDTHQSDDVELRLYERPGN